MVLDRASLLYSAEKIDLMGYVHDNSLINLSVALQLPLGQDRMIGVQPILCFLADSFSQSDHLIRFLIRHRSSPFVSSDIPLLSKRIKLSNEAGIRADGQD